jgi:hypothetical protein
LPLDLRPAANALGACIVDSLQLQSQLISLLTRVAELRAGDREASLQGVTIEAMFNLGHKGKSQVLTGEIATEVNRIVAARANE